MNLSIEFFFSSKVEVALAVEEATQTVQFGQYIGEDDALMFMVIVLP